MVILYNSLMSGVLHSFEPDHVAAVSVMAAEKSNKKQNFAKAVWRAIQWALGHSVTLLLFTGLALLFKYLAETLTSIAIFGELLVGPVMVWLGLIAIKRNHKLKAMMEEHKKIEEHEHDAGTPFHIHGKQGEEIAMDPTNKSFWVGMLHGLAGSGGAVPFALGLAANGYLEAIGVIGLQCVGILIAMIVYSSVLVFSVSRFVERNQAAFKYINGIAGVAAIGIGIWWTIKWVLEYII